MAKILFLSAQYPPESKGGGEISTHIIAQGLTKLGHTIDVITDGSVDAFREVDGIHVRTLPLGLKLKPLFERFHSIRSSMLLSRKIQDISSYDIVHAHDFRSALMLSHLHLPSAVVTARDYAQIAGCTNNIQANGNIDPGCQGIHELFHCHRIAEASIIRKPFRMWQYMYNKEYRKQAFASFPKQIFISGAQKDSIAKHQDISAQRTAVIYNPISEDYLSEPLKKGVSGNVLYAGRVEMYKGVLLLLRAWRKVAASSRQAHLYIAGNGAQREEYERLVATWGLQYRVTFIPHVPYHRLQAMINECEIFVAPHLWVEPFGRTVIEGMARGKLVVSANVGGPAEIITHGKTGLLFERNSLSGLEEALKTALAMGHYDKKEIGIAARDFVRDTLRPEQIAQQHIEFYEGI
jgi:glycosyltransferase involved in cell wall biosynthesis